MKNTVDYINYLLKEDSDFYTNSDEKTSSNPIVRYTGRKVNHDDDLINEADNVVKKKTGQRANNKNQPKQDATRAANDKAAKNAKAVREVKAKQPAPVQQPVDDATTGVRASKEELAAAAPAPAATAPVEAPVATAATAPTAAAEAPAATAPTAAAEAPAATAPVEAPAATAPAPAPAPAATAPVEAPAAVASVPAHQGQFYDLIKGEIEPPQPIDVSTSNVVQSGYIYKLRGKPESAIYVYITKDNKYKLAYTSDDAKDFLINKKIFSNPIDLAA